MALIDEILADLQAESEELDALVAPLPDAAWATDTPAARWTIAHQIGHLNWTDIVSAQAITDPDGFRDTVASIVDLAAEVDRLADEAATMPPAELLARWRTDRASLAQLLAEVPRGEQLPWFGPPMSAATMASARIMETWAHGLDIYDALGVEKPATARVRHVARFGTRTRNFCYLVRGQQPPAEEFRVELTGPDGELWAFGPKSAAQRVTGTAYDFALLATRRRHRDDVDLIAEGDDAAHWLTIVQAFAGLPGEDPKPRGAA